MKKWLITLLVLVGVLLAADFGVAAAAEYQVSKKMRAELGLSADPSVRVNGFPFLTQAFGGDYRDIEVIADGVPVGDKLKDVRVEAHLRDARIPLSDVIGGNLKALTVDRVEGSLKVKQADVGRLLGISDLTIEQDPDQVKAAAAAADPAAAASIRGVKLTGSVDIAGARTQVSVLGTLSLAEGKIVVTPRKLDLNPGIGALRLPDAVQRLVLQAFTTKLDPGTLPFKATPTAVAVEAGALVLTGKAADVTLTGASGLK